jgi:hypothetical protein
MINQVKSKKAGIGNREQGTGNRGWVWGSGEKKAAS